MKNAIWIGRRQVRGLIVLLALLPLIPTSFLVHTMWLNSANDQVRVINEMNGIFRNQLRLGAERFSNSGHGGSRGEAELVQFLIHVFGDRLPMQIISDKGKTVYQSQSPMTGNQFSYRIDSGEFADWHIEIDSISEIPQHIKEEQQSTYRQALFATISTMMIAGGVWLVVNRGLKTHEIRKDLITTISHEIKTPVSAIKILAESLEAGNLTDKLQAEYLNLIASENERIGHLADRFLTYGRLEKGQLPIEMKATDLDDVMGKVTALFVPRFRSAQGEINVSGEKGLVILGDRSGLTILLTNLLENSLKYGGSPPRVLIDIASSGPHVLIDLMDNGQGVPKSERKAVFREFYRSAGRLDDGQTGVGLGLAICRRITRLMKGTLSLAGSKNPDYGGALFQIRLPLSQKPQV